MYPTNFYSWLDYVYMFGGVYDATKITSKSKRFLMRLYNVLLAICCLLYYCPSMAAYLDHTTENLQMFLNNFGLLMTQYLGIGKWLALIMFSSRFERIKAKLGSEEYQYEHHEDFKPGEVIFRCQKFSRAAIIAFAVAGHLVPITKDFDFVISFAKDGSKIGTENVTCEVMLPYYNWIPFHYETPGRCILAFFVQGLWPSAMVAPIIGFDLTFYAVAIHVCGHLINIRNGFITMRKRCLARLGLPEDYDIFFDIENPALAKEIEQEVRKLSIHLQQHIWLLEEMEDLCKFLVLGQALTALFVLVTCLYIISVEPLFSAMFLAQIHYALSINLQLSSYCIVGEAVTTLSADVANGIYESEWLPCTKSVKSSMMINLMRLQKPIYFTIGKFAPLTLNTCIQIVKGSYSYFTFLRTT